MHDPEKTPEELDQIERAKKLTASFAGGSETIAGERLRKLSQADLLILGSVGNRFVNGFSAAERAQAERGNLMPFILDVIQWREVCRADDGKREGWMDSPADFAAHCKRVAREAPADIKGIGTMFADVLRAFQEIQNAQIEVKAPKQAKGQVKKKAPSQRP